MLLIPTVVKQLPPVSAEWVNRLKNAYKHKIAPIHPSPIIILGHQKSGTTAIAALLGQISGLPFTIDPFHHIDLNAHLRQKLFKQELAFDDLVQGHKFYFSTPIIKDPNFTFLYEDVSRCFPQATFVQVMRDPRDTIRSVLNRLKLPGNLPALEGSWCTPLQKMAAKGWSLMIAGNLPQVKGSNYIERLAHRWNWTIDTYNAHRDEIILLCYEDFLQDKADTIRELAQQVGLNPIHDISAQVDIQYQPRGNHQVSWLEFFGKDNLRTIETICGNRMQSFGYHLSEPPVKFDATSDKVPDFSDFAAAFV
ncbi:sulfotransferase family protein [Coleofasciculus sp. G2-EDA-02]|uniref:sulfotransferase family protein n=1 Tax=Coleofasciculus sp. G2-EDA-02 TaxID=3069529 RepID=UPI003302811D